MLHSPFSFTPDWRSPWPWLTWLVGASLMLALDRRLDLANLAMVLMLTSAVATLWLPGSVSAVTAAVAVCAFNWTFVPPRFTFTVGMYQHALLLTAMLVVNLIIAGLMIRLRKIADTARLVAERETRLRTWGDTLRDAIDPAAHASALHAALAEATQAPVALAVLQGMNLQPEDASTLHVGKMNEEQCAGLAFCIRDGQSMGAGTERYGELPDVYLPLRGRGVTLGSAMVENFAFRPDSEDLRPHLQALCDQMGSALHRSMITAQEKMTREQAQLQATRNALLAAISHDYRTPLATIMSAASALHDQADKFDARQRRRMAGGIVEEAERLSRLTDNTLQLARLDAPSVQLRCDWESAEEIVGAMVRRARRRPDGLRLKAWIEPEMPLLWCDAMLVSQLLDNLLDNAFKYSPPESLVELQVSRRGDEVLLAVCDHGPGIAPAWRERIFEVFQRGDPAMQTASVEANRQGAGVGLAVCRAIARAHGGELRLVARANGGCCFEFALALRELQHSPPQESPP